MKKTSKNFKATQTARFGWNKSASLCRRRFWKREPVRSHRQHPTKVSQKRNLGAIQREENQKVGKRRN